MRRKVIIIALLLLISVIDVSAYEGSKYTTPDSWSKTITSNSVRLKSEGIQLNKDGALLSLGLTTRLMFRTGESTVGNVFQYINGRMTDLKLGDMTLTLNLYMRGAYDTFRHSNPREFYVFRSGLDVSKYDKSFEYRLYTGNLILSDILPDLNLTAGRFYTNSMVNQKLDGANIDYTILDTVRLDAYYGFPVSYYSAIHTMMYGLTVDAPINVSGTRLRASANYYQYDTSLKGMSTFYGKARVDQKYDFSNIVKGSAYAEGVMLGNALIYDIGAIIQIPKSKTKVSGYVIGQYDYNNGPVNTFVSDYETLLGRKSEYVMGGVQVSQGIIETILFGLGYEARYNFNEAYGSRDYYRAFANLDLAGLLHQDNFISIIADWYTVPAYGKNDYNDKLLIGARITQMITNQVDLWCGMNVQNYQFKNSPIKLNPLALGYPIAFQQQVTTTNNTLIYVGASYAITKNLLIQLDYTFEFDQMFQKYNEAFNHVPKNNLGHYIEFWFNYVW